MAHSLSSDTVKNLQKTYGANVITPNSKRTAFTIFFEQLKSPLLFILLIAGLISFLVKDVIDGSFIIAVVILNTILGFIQEYKAEKAVEKLKSHSIFMARVIRDEKEQRIDNKELVPGDIIKLSAGDKIPADAVVLEEYTCEVDESVLTGESTPVFKHASDPDYEQLFLGTIMTKGSCKARVSAIGMQTRFGQLAKQLTTIEDERNPFEENVSKLGRQLTSIGIVASSLVFLYTIVYHQSLLQGLLISISLAVAVVPEGLPTIITIALASGGILMAKNNAIIRKMSAIETLGEVTIIATDKTGTLTTGNMEVKKMWVGGQAYEPAAFLSAKKTIINKVVSLFVLCNNAQLVAETNTRFTVLGDTTEGALLQFVESLHIPIDSIRDRAILRDEFSFDTTTNMMSVLYEQPKGVIAYLKGAPENILEISTKIDNGNTVTTISQQQREELYKTYEQFASEGMRTMALAYKDITASQTAFKREEVEKDVTFLGFVGIADPARKEVKEALSQTKAAGIKTVMITGDHELTAITIAKEIGLLEVDDITITGKQLDALTDEAFQAILPTIRIFARCSPDHKLRIVSSYQNLGHIVAVTGDGINDVLALKKAHIGIAMGITGTDVTRDAADIVIADDNFATIVKAIEEGRHIFDNIVKSTAYLTAGNLSEIFTILFTIFLGLATPLIPIQILWINLVTDTIPAIALATDSKHDSLMKRKPKMQKTNILSHWYFFNLVVIALLMAFITIALYWTASLITTLPVARAVAFTSIIFSQMFFAYLMKNKSTGKMNKLLLFGIALTILLQLIILIVPALRTMFEIG